MITTDSVKAKIQGLIDSSNATTGQNDTDLTSAVGHLKEGYGQGGGDNLFALYQDNGNRTDWQYGLAGAGWNDETFRPEYDIHVAISTHMFSATALTDVVGILKARRVAMDFSNDRSTTYLAQNSNSLTTLPVYDARNRTTLQYFIYGCPNLRSIERVILKDDGSQALSAYSFFNLPALEEIRFEGVIGKGGLDFSPCKKLSKASFESIFGHLSTTTNGLELILSEEAKMRIDDEEDSMEWWFALISEHNNWTIRTV